MNDKTTQIGDTLNPILKQSSINIGDTTVPNAVTNANLSSPSVSATTLPTPITAFNTSVNTIANNAIKQASLSPQQIMTQETPEAKTKTSFDNAMSEYNALSNEFGKKINDTQKLNEQFNLSELTREASKWNTSIIAKANEIQLDNLTLAKQLESLTSIGDKPVFADILRGEQVSIQRKAELTRQTKLAELSTMQAIQQSAQGSLESAKQSVKDAINLKYDTLKEILSSKEKQLNWLDKIVTSEEAKILNQRKEQLSLAQKEQEFAREIEQEKTKLMVQASGQGASQDLLIRAMQAKSPMEAATILGKYAGDYIQNQKLMAEIARINADTAKQYNEIAKAKVETGALTQKQVNKYREAYSKAGILSDTAKDVLSVIKNDAIGGNAVGRAITGWIPGTDSRTINNKLDTLKASLGFEELQKMRDNSPTGGALGQVTERELLFLQSAQFNLDSWQDTDELQKTVAAIKESFDYLQYVNQQYLQGATTVIPKEEFIEEKRNQDIENVKKSLTGSQKTIDEDFINSLP